MVFATTIALSAQKFLAGQLSLMASNGWDVFLATADGDGVRAFATQEGATWLETPLKRQPSLSDLRGLVSCCDKLRRKRPDLVVYGTPKASLVWSLASWIARVPTRIYVLHGLPLETRRGVRRLLLQFEERLVAGLSSRIVAVSEGVKSQAVRSGIADEARFDVIGAGSANGVDLTLFFPPCVRQRAQARVRLGLGDAEFVMGYVGRLCREKGIDDLVAAYRLVRAEVPGARLLVVGPRDPRQSFNQVTEAELRSGPGVVQLDWSDDVPEALAAMDVLVMPTSREGLCTIIIEAAACAVPVVAYAVTGVVDAVEDRDTGILVPHKDVDRLARAVVRLAEDEEGRVRMGRAAHRSARLRFNAEDVRAAYVRYYVAVSSQSRRG